MDKKVGDDVTRGNARYRGNSSRYLVARLKRDYPAIAERLAAGEFRSPRAAAIAAGIIQVSSPLDQLRRAWEQSLNRRTSRVFARSRRARRLARLYPQALAVTRAELSHAAKRVQAEGQGVFRLDVTRRTALPALLLASARGEPGATRVLGLIGQFLRHIATEALPEAIVMLTAASDDPTVAISNGLCPGCADKPDLEAAVLAKYREMIPDLRRLPPFGEVGRA